MTTIDARSDFRAQDAPEARSLYLAYASASRTLQQPQPVVPAPVIQPKLLETRVGAPSGEGYVTHYGESYNGQPMGCGGIYSSDNPTIIAVSPARYSSWPCGTPIEICGPEGCIVGSRQDACPGCSANVLDLSESGNALVCGAPAHTCTVSYRTLEP